MAAVTSLCKAFSSFGSRSRLATWKGQRQGRVDGIRHLLFICCLLAITQPRRPDLKMIG